MIAILIIILLGMTYCIIGAVVAGITSRVLSPKPKWGPPDEGDKVLVVLAWPFVIIVALLAGPAIFIYRLCDNIISRFERKD